ncbi:Uncharacterised protein [Dermatophilus congolensis]|uniref:Uncharacterized protein n=1 Tax=Dermatophilus congolensis TaxID=1863 RepID=A0AA46BM69_9MICO|nr:Uncharacterised protein [Dermatophilus congolensis]
MVFLLRLFFVLVCPCGHGCGGAQGCARLLGGGSGLAVVEPAGAGGAGVVPDVFGFLVFA